MPNISFPPHRIQKTIHVWNMREKMMTEFVGFHRESSWKALCINTEEWRQTSYAHTHTRSLTLMFSTAHTLLTELTQSLKSFTGIWYNTINHIRHCLTSWITWADESSTWSATVGIQSFSSCFILLTVLCTHITESTVPWLNWWCFMRVVSLYSELSCVKRKFGHGKIIKKFSIALSNSAVNIQRNQCSLIHNQMTLISQNWFNESDTMTPESVLNSRVITVCTYSSLDANQHNYWLLGQMTECS